MARSLCLLALLACAACASRNTETVSVLEPTSAVLPPASVTTTEAASPKETATAEASPPPAEPPPAPVAEFPERQSVEALDRLSRFVDIARGAKRDVMTLPSDDLFDPGSATLAPVTNARLDNIARALALQGDRVITIIGHTDSLGDRAESTRLSLRRAEAIRDYFVRRGVPAAQLRAEGLGPTRPVAENASPRGRAENRRLEIIIEHPSASPAPG